MNNSDYLTDSLTKFVKHMEQERLSPNTIKYYVAIVIKLSKVESRLYRLSNNQIQDFILDSNSASAQDQKINALKKYFGIIHPKKRIKVYIRPKHEKRLIEVLTTQEVTDLINSINHLKQKIIVFGIYSHGLRISEILNLKYTDVDRANGVLWIRQSKGRKTGKYHYI